jgi:hypothetical protein
MMHETIPWREYDTHIALKSKKVVMLPTTKSLAKKLRFVSKVIMRHIKGRNVSYHNRIQVLLGFVISGEQHTVYGVAMAERFISGQRS